MSSKSGKASAEEERRVCRREDFTTSLVKMTTSEKRQLKMPPRVYSDQFVAYVERELERCAGASADERLQIHREVFQWMLEQFGEHRQLLSRVKIEYDAALERRDERIRRLEGSDRQRVAEKLCVSQRVKAAQLGAAREVEELQTSQAQLRHRLALLCDERRKLQDEVNEVREALLVERRRSKEENDARLLAQADLSDLTQRYDNLLKRVNSRPPDAKSSAAAAEDPVVLRIALNKCREELAAVTARQVVLENCYSEVVPRRELDLALAEVERVRAEGEERVAAVEQVLQEEREREKFRTPRPEWDRAAPYVPGGEAAWTAMRDGLSSCDVLVTLLDELSAPGPDVFTGLGEDPDLVPLLLRYQGDARNLRMTRRQVVRTICDIFDCREKEKDGGDEEQAPEPVKEFPEFVLGYFQERYPLAWPDWTYSFHYALELLTADDVHHLLIGSEAAPQVVIVEPDVSPSVLQPTASEAASPQVTASAVSPEARQQPGADPGAPPTERPSRVMPAGRQSQTTPLPPEGDSQGSSREDALKAPTEALNRRVQLFWNILYGVQHEATYVRDRAAIAQLRKEFCVADAEKLGKVLYDSLGRIISETYFSTKTDEEIERLVMAAAFGRPALDTRHLPHVETVDYARFLDLCRETDSAFVSEFFAQLERAGAAYAARLAEALDDGEPVVPDTLRQAVLALTPDAEPAEVARLCAWVCPGEGEGVPLEQAVERLKGLPLPPERTAAKDGDA